MALILGSLHSPEINITLQALIGAQETVFLQSKVVKYDYKRLFIGDATVSSLLSDCCFLALLIW